MIRRRLVSVLVYGVIGLAFAVSARAANHVVNVQNPMSFSPALLTIDVGDTVTFQKGNTGGTPHNVQSDGFSPGCTPSGTCFRSGAVTTAAFTFVVEFTEAGSFRYFCEAHGAPNGLGMAGRVVVEGTAPTPTPEPPTPTPPPPPPPTQDTGAIRFTNAGYSRAENIGTAAIQVERFSGSDGAVGVSFATSNGSATAGQDYTAASGTLSWANGESGVKTFNVVIANDADDEPNETVNLQLSAPTGGATLGLASATLTIVDEDGTIPTSTIQFTNAAFSVVENMPQATVNVSRTGGSQGAASVEYDTADGSAKAGQDYTAVGGTINWANGDAAQKSIQVPILDDIDSEANESLSVALTQPSGATIGAQAATTLTIIDNEDLPPCEDGEFQSCLLDRFLVRIHWVQNSGEDGEGRAIKLTDTATSFEFFEVGNVEIVVKMKGEACLLPPGNAIRNFWVFVAGLTNVRVELTIIDTESGVIRRFFNNLNQPFFTPAPDSPDGKNNPPGAIQATTEALGAFPTCDA